MNFGGIIAGALGSGARSVGEIASGQIEKGIKVDLMHEQASVDQAKQIAIEQARQDMTLRAATQERDAIGGIIKGAQVPDGATNAQRLTVQRDALNAAGRIDAGSSVDKQIDKGQVVGPYASVVQEGKEVFHNNGADKTAATASSKRADHFDEKEWDAALKPEKDWFKAANDPLNPTKESHVPGLSNAFMERFTALQGTGNYRPNQVRQMAFDYSEGVRERAEELIKQSDPKNPLSMNAAVRTVMNRMKGGGAPADQTKADKAPKDTPARLSPDQKSLYDGLVQEEAVRDTTNAAAWLKSKTEAKH